MIVWNRSGRVWSGPDQSPVSGSRDGTKIDKTTLDGMLEMIQISSDYGEQVDAPMRTRW